MKSLKFCCASALICFWIWNLINQDEAQATARFIPINNFSIRGLSSDGTVVAGQVTNDAAALWTESGGMETFPLPVGYSLTDVSSISGDGTTMIGSIRIGTGLSQRHETFRWTRNAGYQTLGRFSDDWLDRAYAGDVSYDGSVVVGTNDTPDGRRAFRWTQATGQVNLGTLGTLNTIYDPSSDGNGVSADGSIVVGEVTTTADAYYKPYRWTISDGYDVIGLPPVTDGIPTGGASLISGDGLVLAGRSQTSDDMLGWTWTASDGFVYVPAGPGNSRTSAIVSGISFDGSRLVGVQIWGQPSPNANGVTSSAAFWQNTPSGYQFTFVEDLLEASGVDLTGWHLTRAIDISDNGRAIIGDGIDPNGVQRSWYAILSVPEPSSFVSMSLAVVLLAGLRRRVV